MRDKWDGLRARLKTDFSVWAITREEGLELLNELDELEKSERVLTEGIVKMGTAHDRQQRAIEVLRSTHDDTWALAEAERILKGEE